MVAKKIHMILIDKIRSGFNNSGIGARIMGGYFLLLVFSISISTLLYQTINNRIIFGKVSDVSIQTLRSISLNLKLEVDTANNYSKMILTNENIQKALRNPTLYRNLESQRTINQYLTELLISTPIIDSIYIFDNAGDQYSVSKSGYLNFQWKQIKQTDWYQQALQLQGGYVLKLNAGGFIKPSGNNNVVSLIRVMNDFYTQQPAGLEMINISQESMVKSYEGIANNLETSIILKSENNQDIIGSSSYQNKDIQKLLQNTDNREYNAITQKINGRTYLLSYFKIPDYQWKIISIMPFNELSEGARIFSFVAFIFILLNSVLFFFGSLFISRLISNPINQLLHSMKDVESGEFKEVTVKTTNDEIGRLKSSYNVMIREIQNLIQRMREKDLLLIRQSRQAAMGEMIGNIAHQWRQPLNAIGLIIQNIQEAYYSQELTPDSLDNRIQKATEIIQYMSQTIDDFRDFFKPDKEMIDFSIRELLERTVSLVDASFKNNKIQIELDIEQDLIIRGYPNEYSQVILNILINAKDAFATKDAFASKDTFARDILASQDTAASQEASVIQDVSSDQEIAIPEGIAVLNDTINEAAISNESLPNIQEGAALRCLAEEQNAQISGYLTQFPYSLNKNVTESYSFVNCQNRNNMVKIKLLAENGKYIVRITDNAGGIPLEIVDKIFEPYFTTKEQGQGTGLGLYMAKTIIEKHMGGALSARNVNDGAEFQIEV